jgi:creatinine amidohydrolase/Fe(II)-dependent formamide hydrolase-like protein
MAERQDTRGPRILLWDALPPDELAAHLGSEVGLHANVGETSAVLAVDESLVDLELAVPEYPPFPVEPTPAMVSAFLEASVRFVENVESVFRAFPEPAA